MCARRAAVVACFAAAVLPAARARAQTAAVSTMTIDQAVETALARHSPELGPADYRGRTWVTRKNVHVDRIASAWLIRRFIDTDAKFKFVPGQGYKASDDELTFDMYEGTFTHVGDACTFETLVDRFGLTQPGLGAIAEIVHDIDVKDGKFARTEAPGIAAMIAGIATLHREDERRIEVGGGMLDALLDLFSRKGARGDR